MAKRKATQIVCLVLISVIFLFIIGEMLMAQANQDTSKTEQSDKKDSDQSNTEKVWWTIGTIMFLFLLLGGILIYLRSMQREFLIICDKRGKLDLFAQNPAGLPKGTVRSVITFIIVIISLYIIILMLFGFAKVDKFPEILGAVLTTVIAFYFGTRSAAGSQAESETLATTEKQRNEAIKKGDAAKAETLLKKVNKNVKLVRKIMTILPKDVQQKYGKHLNELEKGVQVAEDLFNGGNLGKALEKAKESYDHFVAKNPFRDIIEKAVKSFKEVSGISVPPLAIISTVIGISSTVVGGLYEKWKARILHLPFKPALIPLKVEDADTGFVVLVKCKIFKEVFKKELEGMHRPFMEKAAKEFTQMDADEIWKKYKNRFESKPQFDQGIQEFRRVAADMEIRKELDPSLSLEAGGYDQFTDAIDKIHSTKEAQADLHRIMEISEGLRKNNEPVKDIFDKIRQEIQS